MLPAQIGMGYIVARLPALVARQVSDLWMSPVVAMNEPERSAIGKRRQRPSPRSKIDILRGIRALWSPLRRLWLLSPLSLSTNQSVVPSEHAATPTPRAKIDILRGIARSGRRYVGPRETRQLPCPPRTRA